jgi:hypothetical protein
MIRYGIIGCGSMGREHIENLKAMGGGASPRWPTPRGQPRRGAALHRRQRPQRLRDHRELLASGLCDAVVIATPNFTHIEMMRDALAPPTCTSWSKSRWSRAWTTGSSCCARAKGAAHRLGGAGIPLHAAGGRDDPHGARRRGRAHPPGGDPRTPRTLLPQGRRLEPLQRQHRRHAGREVLPLLQPDGPDPEGAPGARVRQRRPAREPSRRVLRRPPRPTSWTAPT